MSLLRRVAKVRKEASTQAILNDVIHDRTLLDDDVYRNERNAADRKTSHRSNVP
jgi:hypothetical protein